MVAEGYKNTKIGVIPKDWKVVHLNKVATIVGGSTPSSFNKSYWNGNINWFTPTEVGDSKYVYKSIRKITQLGYENCSAKILPVGTIILTTRAVIGDLSILKVKACTNQGFQSFITNRLINNEYLYYRLAVLKNILLLNASGSTFLEISLNKLRNIKIPLPPLSEQNAIATALSDADALISATEKLIAKKKAIKQGAMQELLKPKEGWEEKTLEEDFDIIKGQGLSKSKLDEHGKLECILYGELFTTYKELIREVNSKTNSEEGIMSKFGDILFPGSTTTVGIDLAKCSTILTNNVMIGRDIIVLRKKQKHINPKFIFYYLNIKCKYKIAAKTKGVTIYHLHGKDLSDIKISYPDYQEQTRIATILSDMDAEISLLEQKLEKQKQIKQGMMQNLLTGKIRLLGNKEEQVKKPKHNEQINEAVVISFLVHKFGTEKYPLSRFRYTKYAYLLHRQSEREARGFDKYAAGPYNPANRYKGAEDIAVKNKYITKVQNPTSQNDAFVVNENIEGALNYFQEWYGTEIQQWIEQFKFYKNEYLEVLTTIDKAICELIRKKIIIDVPNIKSYIASIPQWKNKLEKPYFSDIEIQKAIDESNKLFGNG